MGASESSRWASRSGRAAAGAVVLLASLGSVGGASEPATSPGGAPLDAPTVAAAGAPETSGPADDAPARTTADPRPSVTSQQTHQGPCPGPDGRVKWLKPPSDTNPINTDHTVTAKVVDHTDAGEECEGVEVLFEVSEHGNPSPASGIAITGSKGNASFTFTNSEPSLNVIHACTTIWGTAPATCDPTDPDQHVAMATKEWVAPGYFTCRASVFRMEGSAMQPGVLPEPFEPAVANDHGPDCQSDTAGLVPPTTILGGSGALTVLGAASTSEPFISAHSEAGVLHLSMTDGTSTLELSVLTAEAAGACSAGAPVLSGASKVLSLTVNGSGIVIPPAHGHVDVSMGPLGVVHLNEGTTVPTVDGAEHTQRAFWLQGNPVLGDVIVAEAIAGYHGDPCPPAI